MKKLFLIVLAVLAVNVTFAQADDSGKPWAECLMIADFNRKIAQVRQAEKIFLGQLIHIRGNKTVRQVNFAKAGTDIKNFDVYKWLMTDTSTTGAGKELGSPKALPTDRLYMEFEFVKSGKVKSFVDNVRFCENSDPIKVPKPSLKLEDKSADGKICFKLTDFKSKIQGLPQDDTLSVTYTLFNTEGEKAVISFTTFKELKQFNLYNWLTKGAEVTTAYGPDKIEKPTPEGKKVIAQPGDLVIVTLRHKRKGQESSQPNQFPICSTSTKK